MASRRHRERKEKRPQVMIEGPKGPKIVVFWVGVILVRIGDKIRRAGCWVMARVCKIEVK